MDGGVYRAFISKLTLALKKIIKRGWKYTTHI
jgi:hypothetical protein